jgi:multiple sugar transport system permease protein
MTTETSPPIWSRSNTPYTIALVVVGGATLLPFVWMVLTSFKTTRETLRFPPTFLPEEWSADSYARVFESIPFTTQLLNTVVVTIATVVLTVVIAAMAAFGLEIVRVPGRSLILIALLTVTMVPGEIFMIPQYQIIAWLGMTDTLVALVMPNVFSAFGAFLLAQQFRTFPRELVDAARLDGAGYLRVFFQILLPNAKAPITALAVMTMLSSWSDLLWPLVANRSPDKLTLGPGLAMLRGTHFTDMPLLMAAGVMAALPMVVLFLLMQRQFTQSFAQSGMK